MLSEQSRRYYLQTMGIDVWIPKGSDDLQKIKQEEISDLELPSRDNLPGVHKVCSLCNSRSHVVVGAGDNTADLLIIAEEPGFYQDKQNKALIDKAGQLLDKMLLSIGLKRELLYIVNVFQCRSSKDRELSATEVAACNACLAQQIQLIRPKAVLALGQLAARHLLNTDGSIASLRKQTQYLSTNDTPVIVSYPPASLLAKPKNKAKSFQDLLKLRAFL